MSDLEHALAWRAPTVLQDWVGSSSHWLYRARRILGHRWHSGGLFTAEDKKLKALLELPHDQMADIPVHSIYGLLNFFRCYVPDFAIRTEPLRKLLAHSHAGWTE